MEYLHGTIMFLSALLNYVKACVPMYFLYIANAHFSPQNDVTGGILVTQVSLKVLFNRHVLATHKPGDPAPHMITQTDLIMTSVLDTNLHVQISAYAAITHMQSLAPVRIRLALPDDRRYHITHTKLCTSQPIRYVNL